MHDHHNSVTPTRRTIAKGAAWTVPVVVSAAAAPMAAASPTTCATCLTAIGGDAPASTATVNNYTGDLVMTPLAFGILGQCSGLVSIGVVVVNSATLTMSGRRNAETTPTTYTASTLAAGVAGGALGATAIGFTGTFAFPSVSYPAGTYVGLGPLDSSPIKPTRLCVRLSIPLNFGIGTTTCSMTVCYTPTFISATAGYVSATLGGFGNVAYGTSWIGSSVTAG